MINWEDMRQVLIFLVALCLFFFRPVNVAAQSDPGLISLPEAITSFSTRIEVKEDQSLQIVETIVYHTQSPKHGILRYIPIRYRREGRTVTLPPRDFKVTDEAGESIPFSRSSDGENVTLKIGRASETFTGTRTYVISYRVNEALETTSQGLRLYWDITGEGWSFPIMSSRAVVSAPTGTIGDVMCYSGAFGTNDGACSAARLDSHEAEFAYPRTVEPGDNFTVDVQFEGTSGFIVPTPTQKLFRALLSYWWVFVLLLPPILVFRVWYRMGRDYMYTRYNPYDHTVRHVQLKPILTRITPPFVYEPLDISPGQAGAMLDESYDNHDLVADVLDLARLKLITIKQIQKKTLFKTADYEFHKLKTISKLPHHQRLIMEALFAGGEVVKLSELKGKFYSHIPKIREALFAELFAHTMFTRNPWEFQKKVGTVAIVIVVIAFVSWQVLAPFLFSFIPVIPITILVVLDLAIIFVLVTRLTQKTGKGFNYMLLSQGLRETIRRGKWREEIKEKHLFIEEILPFAVSLNVVDKLSADMKDLGLEPPQYVGGSTTGFTTTQAFVSGFTSDVSSNLSYNPSSSSGGGGSFGGGSSGGGGGGGGGGSW